MSRLNIVKNTGDKLSANEFNAVVDAINDNNDKNAQNATDIALIAGRITPSYYLTQEEYDALVEQGDIDENADYNIYEE